MNARIITALLALLGFGAACSGVKETAKSTDSRADSVRVQRPIRLMYGVPVREFQARPLADSARGEGRASVRRGAAGRCSGEVTAPFLRYENPGFLANRGLL